MPKKILVVDDEAHVRLAIQLALKGAGYEVDTAKSADDALPKVTDETNLILLDIMMPGMRPVDLIKTLSQHQMDVKVIYVSAVPFEEERKREMMRDGLIVDYIQKPFENKELFNKVKKAVGEP